MKKIVAFAGSNSSKSINKQLVTWASSMVLQAEIELLDLNDFEMPIYSMDREKGQGIPEEAVSFKDTLKSADGLMISLAEHNHSYSAAFKNIFDWFSRIERPIWPDAPMFLMATSPGRRGGQNVLNTAKSAFPHLGAQIVASFSLPSFYDNFKADEGITSEELKATFDEQLAIFNEAI
ncbi:MAG: NAD(P)H-dependent oxidoreductase [Bacteroidota bacterium]